MVPSAVMSNKIKQNWLFSVSLDGFLPLVGSRNTCVCVCVPLKEYMVAVMEESKHISIMEFALWFYAEHLSAVNSDDDDVNNYC